MFTRTINLTFAVALVLGIAAPVAARAELPHEKLHRFLFGDGDNDRDHHREKRKKYKDDRDEYRYERRHSKRHRCYDHNHSGYCDECGTRLTVIEPAPVRVYPRVHFEYYRGYDRYDRYDRPIEVDVQIALRNRGYYGGPIDGDIGPGTRYAIREYQYDYRLPVTGRIDRYLIRSLGVRWSHAEFHSLKTVEAADLEWREGKFACVGEAIFIYARGASPTSQARENA